jgi:hypothetical protein
MRIRSELEMNATHPLELIQSLSPEEKETLLMGLLREAIRVGGDSGPMSIDDEDGAPIGTLVLRASPYRQTPPGVTPDEEADFIRRHKNRGRLLSEEEFKEWLSQAGPDGA